MLSQTKNAGAADKPIEHKCAEQEAHQKVYAECGADPMALVLALRRNLCEDAQLFVDVTVSEHLAAEAFTVCRPRTYFNPTDNQSMGWSIPAALGAQRASPESSHLHCTQFRAMDASRGPLALRATWSNP